jgi:hypothetical protein
MTMARTERLGLSREEAKEEADRQTASLAGLALVLFLVVAGLYVVHQLAIKAAVEDCLLAQRANCDAVLSASR